MTVNKANILEIFSSIQGEGIYIGYRQLFIRFSGCNLGCKYCDTDFSESEICKIEICPGSGNFKNIKNPITSAQLVHETQRLTYFNHHSISLTGGEPLLHVNFLAEFLPEIKKNSGLKIYLETNGSLFKKLQDLVEYIDIISMDIKLASSTGTETPWFEHGKFAQTAIANKKEIFLKAVVTNKVQPSELKEIGEFAKLHKVPLILQPASQRELSLSPEDLLRIQEVLLKELKEVRIIPQTHKYLNLM